eukprot:m.171068 g.171068  ORF g.171068 m.171068 type:complete len:301 (-) comp24216_c0_seq2:165-1067(-)
MFMTALVPKSRRLFGPGGGHSRVIRVARSQGISRAPRRRWLASFGGTGLPENLRNKLNILLTKSEVSQLMAALGNRAGEAAAAPATRPTKLQLRRYFLQGMLPMIGFGFVDNAIMIMAGDAIDQTLGARLQISTLAAAGLGNMVSDVCGLGLSSYVEAFATKIGIPSPGMTMQQVSLPVARVTMLAASVVGIVIGCLLGMVPLLFLKTDATTAEHIFRTLDQDESGRVSLEEIRPFLTHLGLDASRPKQISRILGVDVEVLNRGVTREQFDDIWLKTERRKHDGLRSLAKSIVAERNQAN